MKTKLMVAVAAILLAVLAGVGYTHRQCPGHIVCPLTGQIICALACPAR